MPVARRKLALAVLFGVLLAPAFAQQRVSRVNIQLGGLPNAAASGDVTADSAVVWARARDPGFILFQLWGQGDPWLVSRFGAVWIGDPMVPGKFEFTGLKPNTRYFYRAISYAMVSPVQWSPRSRLTATGTFRTPALPGVHTGLRFGVSGDWRGELAPYPSIANARHRGLSFFVALGDTTYADFPSPNLPLEQATTLEEFRIKHEEVYAERFGLNALGELRAAMPILAVIDDHEVNDDFSGGAPPATDPRFEFTTESFINETPLFLNGVQAFHEYNPIKEEFYGDTGDPRTAHKARLYRARRYGNDAAVFVLDARSFRDAGLPPVQDPTNVLEVLGFLTQSFDPTRTMLGAAQLTDLENDLLQAQQDGVTWKFIMTPEPIQNLGPIFAEDRFEGYAAERAELLSFIATNGIQNAVFVAADLHGTVVNNLTFQTSPLGPQISVDAFEVVTGPVAYDAPLGPTIAEVLAALGLISPLEKLFYDSLPREGKDAIFATLIDTQLEALGYDPIGLDGSSIDATLVQGGYVAAHVYGWTEFRIDPVSQDLTVTTWGIDPYTEADLADPGSVVRRVPTIVSQFVVRPK